MLTTTLPNYVVVGAMRCGTTALARYLGAHPDVFMAKQKEVRYFDRHFDRGIEWYAQQFSRANGERSIGEATPYLHDDIAVARMAQTLPSARLVAILRNPVDRAYSHYWLRRARKKESLEFEEIVEAGLTGTEDKLGNRPFLGSSRPSPAIYVGFGRYLDRLVHLCSLFPREHVHVVLLEDLVAEPEGTYRSITRFLGVDDEFVPGNLGRAVNSYVTYRSVWLRNAARRVPRHLRRVIGRLNTVPSNYPPMSGAIRRKLVELYREDNDALARWLDRDLSLWKR